MDKKFISSVCQSSPYMVAFIVQWRTILDLHIPLGPYKSAQSNLIQAGFIFLVNGCALFGG